MKILLRSSPDSQRLIYTELDPNSQEGLRILNSHFLSQSVPVTGVGGDKFKRLGPQIPYRDLLNMAFKV